ncbi:MAG: hypothetical protein JWO67_106 [Streptosporangiaceae bacterium]|jgi:hypothetical protein|nr:hypothetical protein [Streptosporangiaceae bacterium]
MEMTDSDSQWWFCLRHMRVEHGAGCPGKDRMGPYDSKEAAAGALELARQRNEAWRSEDDSDD